MSTFITVFFCLISGIVTRLSLTFANQKWANTYHNTVVYLLLPIITFAITKVISNNIALSLGMVGALSIVRFRNPVKNPLELTIYFLLISYGITFGVDLKYGILLLVSSSILIVSIGWWALGMRAMMITMQGEDYMIQAEAKGLNPRRIFVSCFFKCPVVKRS